MTSRRAAPPEREYKITYRMVLKERSMVIKATSKYDAKQKFYREHPRWEIVKVEEALRRDE